MALKRLKNTKVQKPMAIFDGFAGEVEREIK